MSILLIVYVGSGLLLILVSLPLLWGKIPPNPIYGFRVRATLEDPAIWYLANKFAAKRLIRTGAVVVGAALSLYSIPGLSGRIRDRDDIRLDPELPVLEVTHPIRSSPAAGGDKASSALVLL
jgi:SdpI/YfhL protein family